jgi:hypothetical protein
MRRSMLLAAVLAGVCLCGVAGASPLAVTAKVGTLGYGGDVTVNLGPWFNVRAGYNTMSYEDETTLDEAEVEGRLDWQTIPLLLDWHPARSGFRISAGAVLNDNEITLSATPTQRIELDGREYRIDRLDGSITFDQVAWYFGIGYGDATAEDGHWHFACDFGVMYHGEPEVEATATASNARVQSALNAALAAEIATYQDDIDSFAFYPVIAVGVSLNF